MWKFISGAVNCAIVSMNTGIRGAMQKGDTPDAEDACKRNCVVYTLDTIECRMQALVIGVFIHVAVRRMSMSSRSVLMVVFHFVRGLCGAVILTNRSWLLSPHSIRTAGERRMADSMTHIYSDTLFNAIIRLRQRCSKSILLKKSLKGDRPCWLAVH